MAVSRGSAAVVTGAASGIGLAVARRLAARGLGVAMVDLDGAAVGEAARGIAGATAHACDVADEAAVVGLRDDVLAAHGAVGLLVNNAGVSAAGPADEVPLAVFRRTMDVNFWGTVLVTRAFLPTLHECARTTGKASVVNVLSDFALFSLPTKAPYAASKHAARAFTEALGAELHHSGIRVTAVYPGATATSIVARGFAVDAGKQALEAGFLARGMPPDAVARRIVDAAAAGRARVLVGRDTRAIDLAVRLAPGIVGAVLRRVWRRIPFL